MSYLGTLSQDILVDSKSIYITSPYSGKRIMFSEIFKEMEPIFIEASYPVGTIIYLSEDIDPSDMYPGNWQRFSEGRVLLSTSSDPLTQGGEYSHTLVVNEMPSHNHQIPRLNEMGTADKTSEYGGSATASKYTGYTGSAYAHNNIQPYSAHYCWRRVS